MLAPIHNFYTYLIKHLVSLVYLKLVINVFKSFDKIFIITKYFIVLS